MASNVSDYLVRKASEVSPEAAEVYTRLEDLYSRRLWHQVTGVLQDFVRSDVFNKEEGGGGSGGGGGRLTELYENVIESISDRLAPVAFAQLAIPVAAEKEDTAAALAFLEGIQEKVKKDDMAGVCVTTAIAELHVHSGELDKCKSLLAEIETALDSVGGVTPMHAAYYRVSALYNSLCAEHAAFYTDALRYLGCIDVADLPVAEAVERAVDLSIAALLGKGIYNFGELLAHPVLETLKGTDKSWLIDLLFAFNAGNVTAFEELAPHWQAQDDLKDAAEGMRAKIRLLALMELVFKAPAQERNIPFAKIAETVGVTLDDVEMFVMKALSLGLVRGTIDQVDQLAHMNWVQPRVLDTDQVSTLAQQLGAWCSTVTSTSGSLETTAPELFVS